MNLFRSLTLRRNMIIFLINTPEKTALSRAREEFMLSQMPVDFTKVAKEKLDQEILRAAIIAELDAINLYEQMAALANYPDIKAVLLDIAREEKTHVGEFQTMLLRLDAEQVKEMEHARKEIEEITGK
jgi:rubrerythrin